MEKIRLRLSKWRKKLFAIITMIVSLVVIMFVGVPIWFPLSPSTGNGSSGPTVYNWTSWLSPLSDGTYGSNQVYPASPTTHFDKVNDTDAGASAPDNATTYIYSGNTANSYDDTYYIANTTLPPGAYNINATVWICAENDITGSYYGRYATDFRVGSTLETGTQTHQTGTPVYLNISTVYATNPVTSAAWVASDFLNNNLQIGARLTTIVHSSIPYYGYCTAAWLIINCTVPLPYVATSPSPVQIGVNTTFVSYWNFSGATCYGSFTGNVTGFTATTTQAMSGQWFNVSFITPTPNNTVIQWAMICNDTANKQWTSGTQTTTLKEMNLQVNYTGDGAYSGYDDVFINSTNTYYSTSQTQQGYDGTAGVNSTYRFRHLPYLTRASTVNHAYLNFTYYSNKASTAWMRITLCVSPSIDGSKVSTAFTLAKVAGYVDWQLPTAQAQNTSVVTSDAASLVTAFLNNSAYSSLSSSMTFVLSYLNGTGIQEFWACNGNATSAAILTVDFNMYPEYESVVETPSVPVSGVSQQLDVQYIYWRNMTQYLYQTNNTGTATNSSLATVTDGVYPYRWANFTYTLNDSNPWIIDNFVYGNSTLGYLSVTEIQLSPLYTNYNSSLLGTIITSTNVYSLTHTTGRRVFYDNNTASWIAWYSDGHNMFYAFSTDGVNWFNKTSLGNILNDANFNNANCTVGDHF